MVYIDFSILIDNIGINAKIDYFNKLNNIHESSLSLHSHVVYEVYFIEEGEMSVRLLSEKSTVSRFTSFSREGIFLIEVHVIARFLRVVISSTGEASVIFSPATKRVSRVVMFFTIARSSSLIPERLTPLRSLWSAILAKLLTL